MTARAVRGLVGTVERERGMRMRAPPDARPEPGPPDRSVAPRTVISKRSFVYGAMTIHATGPSRRWPIGATVMTSGTIYAGMPTPEAQPGVAIADAAHVIPPRGTMTIRALRAEPIGMGVLMAAPAGRKIEPSIPGGLPMALNTLCSRVLAS